MKFIIFSKVLKDLPMIEALKISAKIGYEGIELHDCHFPANIDPKVVDDLSKVAREQEIELSNLATFVGGFSKLKDADCRYEFQKFERYLNFAHLLGIHYIRLNPGGPDPESATENEWQKASLWLCKAADLASPHNISIVLEMHEGSLIATVESTMKLLDMINRDNVVINYDVGNIFHVPADYGVDALRMIEGRVRFVHVRDEKGKGKDGQWIYTLFGDGIIDYRPIFRRLKEINFRGYLSAECHFEPTLQISSGMIANYEFKAIRDLWEIS